MCGMWDVWPIVSGDCSVNALSAAGSSDRPAGLRAIYRKMETNLF